MIFGIPPLLACGLCLDSALTGKFPFLAYWLLCMVLWGGLIGPALHATLPPPEKEKNKNPVWLVLLFCLALIANAPFSGGAIVAPILYVLPVWLVSIIRALQQKNTEWQKIHRILAAVLVLCVVVSYLIPYRPFARYREDTDIRPKITQVKLRVFEGLIRSYKEDCAAYPSDLEQLLSYAWHEGILNRKDRSQPAQRDGWQQPIQYTLVPDGPLLWSYGPDGKPETQNDIQIRITDPLNE